jgi:rhodanese-related sulfurtransferase
MDLVTYCDCPNDISAARAALRLRQRGVPAKVLAGGFSAWVAAGFAVESAGAAGSAASERVKPLAAAA